MWHPKYGLYKLQPLTYSRLYVWSELVGSDHFCKLNQKIKSISMSADGGFSRCAWRRLCCCCTVVVSEAVAQSVPAPPGSGPKFEVASVRLADKEVAWKGARVSPGLLTINGLSLRDCIQLAYQLPTVRVIAPKWIDDLN